MKKLKFLIVILSIGLFTLTSCEDNGPVTNPQPEATQSIALRTVLNSIKKSNDPSGRIASTSRSTASEDNGFCFDFVYPLQFEYNDGTLVSVESFEGLIQILMNETPDLYLVGIVFPFDIVLTADSSTVTITSEQDLIEVLENCDDFDVWDEDDVIIDCFEFVYPFDMIAADGSTVTITSEDDLIDFLENQGQMYEPIFVFPITVTNLDGEDIVIENIYEFFELMDDCYAYGYYNDCDCVEEYEPVCVFDPNINMTIPFPNECFALCEGFTEDDFIDCGFGDYEMYFMDAVGVCFNFVYPLEVTLNGFTYEVLSFAQLEQYFDPMGEIGEIQFPVQIEIISTGETETIQSMEDLQEFINDNCE